jgi:hypothetical protein
MTGFSIVEGESIDAGIRLWRLFVSGGIYAAEVTRYFSHTIDICDATHKRPNDLSMIQNDVKFALPALARSVEIQDFSMYLALDLMNQR